MIIRFFFNVPAPTDIYTLSLHDALPISLAAPRLLRHHGHRPGLGALCVLRQAAQRPADRKSTRLNSSHRTISYAVFCLKKKKERTGRVLGQCPEGRRRAVEVGGAGMIRE